ncbi:hypothetical protein FPOAC1_003864 [Fusarium poae]|uniref:hypothetical protein n=1 Tax=Fusarium poae TaxID=36050 RepID=UPI001CE87E8D|nr:hypothetical protein FPOAC1_003864 [Fusarium poae]KAG8677836.1 hypothetical protein FPOAC1_003864 [Fusarium poae]
MSVDSGNNEVKQLKVVLPPQPKPEDIFTAEHLEYISREHQAKLRGLEPKQKNDAAMREIVDMKHLKLRLPSYQFLKSETQWPAGGRYVEAELLMQMMQVIGEWVVDFLGQYTSGIIALWSKIISKKLKSTEETVKHVDEFPLLVRRYRATEGAMPDEIEQVTFISSVEAIYPKWVGLVRFAQRISGPVMETEQRQNDLMDESKRLQRAKKTESKSPSKDTNESNASLAAESNRSSNTGQHGGQQDYSECICHEYNQKGHINRKCPNLNNNTPTGSSNLNNNNNRRPNQSHAAASNREAANDENDSFSFACNAGDSPDAIVAIYKRFRAKKEASHRVAKDVVDLCEEGPLEAGYASSYISELTAYDAPYLNSDAFDDN